MVQIDALVGTGPHSGRGLLRPNGGMGGGSARLISPRTLGAAGFRFATSKRGPLENELDSRGVSLSKVASRTAAGGDFSPLPAPATLTDLADTPDPYSLYSATLYGGLFSTGPGCKLHHLTQPHHYTNHHKSPPLHTCFSLVSHVSHFRRLVEEPI